MAMSLPPCFGWVVCMRGMLRYKYSNDSCRHRGVGGKVSLEKEAFSSPKKRKQSGKVCLFTFLVLIALAVFGFSI